jgi:hypothetical protein
MTAPMMHEVRYHHHMPTKPGKCKHDYLYGDCSWYWCNNGVWWRLAAIGTPMIYAAVYASAYQGKPISQALLCITLWLLAGVGFYAVLLLVTMFVAISEKGFTQQWLAKRRKKRDENRIARQAWRLSQK